MVSSREVLHSSASNEWYTPVVYTEAARKVMGSIDLDPASCDEANKLVKATKIFTKEDDGLNRKWWGNVWMNPPYGRGGQDKWTSKIVKEYEDGNISQAVILVNAATDTLWFQRLWPYNICFVKRRIKFVSLDGAPKHSPTHGNVLVYLGRREESISRFRNEFKRFGPIVHSTILDSHSGEKNESE